MIWSMGTVTDAAVDQACQQAGYLLMDEETEDAVRDLALNYPNDPDEARNQIWLAIKNGTGGVVFSQDEVHAFIHGHHLRDILSIRLSDSGNIKMPFTPKSESSNPASETEQERVDEGWLGCRCGWRGIPETVTEERVAGYVGLNNGHGMSLMRPMTETDFFSVCPNCGRKLYDPDLEKAKQEGENAANRHLFFWVFGILAFIAFLVLLAGAAKN